MNTSTASHSAGPSAMVNSRDPNQLHPTLQRGYRELLQRFDRLNREQSLGFAPVGVSSTYRCRAYQNHLFAQGRDRPGAIVTRARGGYSTHNHRLAFDVFQNQRGREWEHPFFETLGRLWTDMGGVWGGNWTAFVDRPHFEYTGGLSVSQLAGGAQLPSDAVMPWEWEQSEAVGSGHETNEPNPSKLPQKPRFATLQEIPDWGQPTVTKLMARGVLKGTPQGLDLSGDMVRLLVIHDRLGLYL